MTVRLRNTATGVVVSVEGDKVSRMGRGWVPVTVPTRDLREPSPDESWTIKRLREYARTNDISIGAATSKSDILAIVTK